MIPIRIISLLILSALLFLAGEPVQAEAPEELVQRWSILDGKVRLDLPSHWKKEDIDRIHDGLRTDEPRQVGFATPDRQGSLKVVHYGVPLGAMEPQELSDLLEIICQQAGLSVSAPQPGQINGRLFSLLECVGRHEGRTTRAWAGATTLDGCLLIFLFTARGLDTNQIMTDARLAMWTIQCGTTTGNGQAQREGIAVSPHREFGHAEIPGYGVSLKIPVDFTPLGLRPGFSGPGRYNSLYRVPSPLPYAMTKANLTDDSVKLLGGRILYSEEILKDGNLGLLCLIYYAKSSPPFKRWVLLLGDDPRSLMLYGDYTLDARPEMQDQIYTSLLSVDWDSSLEPIDLSGLGFTFSESPRLKLHCRAHNRVILKPAGSATNLSDLEGFLFISRYRYGAPIEDLAAFAEESAEDSNDLGWVKLQPAEEFELDGLPGLVSRGEVILTEDGQKRDFFQVLAVHQSYVYLVRGFQKPNAGSDLLKDFELVARSVKRTDDP